MYLKNFRIIKLSIFFIISLQIVTAAIVINYLKQIGSQYILSISVFFMTTLIIIIVFGIGFIYFFPTYQKTNRISKLNRIIYDLLQQSAYVKKQNDFYHIILERALECIDQSKKGSIMLMDPSSERLYFAAAIGYDMKVLSKTYLKLEQTYLYRESQGNITKTIKIHDPFEYDRKKIDSKNIDEILKAGSDNIMTTLSAPIYYEGKLHGMMNIDSPSINAYDSYDMEVIELFAAEIANVLKLFKTIEKNEFYMNYDNLTKLPNRKFILEIMDSIHSSAKHKRGIYSVVSIDINYLKQTNDLYGHSAGDYLLKSFACEFQDSLPESCSIGRCGGDEFLAILPQMSIKESKELLASIHEKLTDKPLQYKENMLPLSFSYGLASYGQDGYEIDKLINYADEKMYKQKKEFHNNYPKDLR